ncbi:MAG: LPP20 family lipoprotein [Flavobacteriales bacterium]|jgi:hypothetical protein
MKILRYLAILSILFSCGSRNKITETYIGQNARPEWVFSRPIEGSYFIGIGSSNKKTHLTDYSIVAKKNALTDMSSEITVNISGESFYHTIDNNFDYSEEFQSMVRSTFKEEITDYEIVDSWENENEFWIFTRISKSEHVRLKNLKKTKVLDQSYANYKTGLTYKTEGKLADALDLFSKGLLNMKEYWSENNLYLTGTENLFLDNALYEQIRKICSELELISSENTFNLSYKNGFSNSISIAVKNQEHFIPNLPVFYKFTNRPYAREKKLYTNPDGLINIFGENFTEDTRNFELKIWVDYDELFKNDSSPEISELLTAGINNKMLNIPAKIIMPSIYLRTNSQTNPLAESFKNELLKKGFIISTSELNADLDVILNYQIDEGGTAQGFHVVLLDLTITIEDHQSHRQLFSDSYTNIKGIHMNTNGAEGDAVKNAVKKIKKELVPKLMDVLL